MTNAILATKPNLQRVQELLKKQNKKTIQIDFNFKKKSIEDMTKEEFKLYMDYLKDR